MRTSFTSRTIVTNHEAISRVWMAPVTIISNNVMEEWTAVMEPTKATVSVLSPPFPPLNFIVFRQRTGNFRFGQLSNDTNQSSSTSLRQFVAVEGHQHWVINLL